MLHTVSRLLVKFLVGVGLLLAVSHISAQSSQTGGIIGVVKDASGAVIAGAAVTVSSLETGVTERRVSTNTEGSYTAASLRPGSYRLEIIDKGFNRYVATLAVRINDTVRHDVTLEVGTFHRRSQFMQPVRSSTHRIPQPASLSTTRHLPPSH